MSDKTKFAKQGLMIALFAMAFAAGLFVCDVRGQA